MSLDDGYRAEGVILARRVVREGERCVGFEPVLTLNDLKSGDILTPVGTTYVRREARRYLRFLGLDLQ